MRFFLGTHRPSWLALTDVDLFVSNRTLAGRKSYPRALGEWALDSGAFSELSMHGGWLTSPERYIANVRLYSDEVGGLQWAAPQDWMCEPFILAKTGLTIAEHQRRTVLNYLELRERAPDLPFVPVLQGWTLDDYQRCVDLYAKQGVNLQATPLVGLGSVCRRQGTGEIHAIVEHLSRQGLRLHGFGVKVTGLARYAEHLASADSLAWSYHGRRHRLPGHTHQNCANCLPYALQWRARLP